MGLRIIGGKHRSRILKAVSGVSTRPTRSMVREAAFNILQGYVQNAYVLDLFAGSGAMGLEAISRGAEKVVFCDKERKAIQVAKENAVSIQEEERCRFLQMDWKLAMRELRIGPPFELVFLDPPYQMELSGILLELGEHGLLAPGAIILTEQDAQENLSVLNGYHLLKQRSYGQTTLSVLQWEGRLDACFVSGQL